MNTQQTRPFCQVPGCSNPCVKIRTNKKTGRKEWRKFCSGCHNSRTAANHGFNTIAQITAKRNGFSGVTDYRNSKHPYRHDRKDYCENIDGRLGFKCTYPTELPLINGVKCKSHLQVDHIDGDHHNNDQDNLQTLCACCHAYKTIMNNDAAKTRAKNLKKTQASKETFDRLFETLADSVNIVVSNGKEKSTCQSTS